jgi:antitoxin component of MazEF toxin-antitoxin module
MRAVHVSIRQIGNSQGIVIPKPVLAKKLGAVSAKTLASTLSTLQEVFTG